ncbi:MAG: VTT domain-containing protein [Flavobacteriia bacterium]|nr:VTT domain-containing protein [Flavobacteriia bacterium]
MSPIKRFWSRQIRVHRYFKITGGYKFVGENLLRLLLFLIAFGVVAWLINEYVFSFSDFSNQLTSQYSPVAVVAWLFVSEVIIGLLPPEAFILWAESFEHSWAMLLILATVSYLGGVISFLIGQRMDKFTRIHAWLHNKLHDQISQIKRFGGLLIAIAALTPLPYPLFSMIAGLSGVKLGLFLRVALIRYVRFVIYALVLWKAIA